MANETTVCRFFRLVQDAPEPRRADFSADGMLPVRGYRYCEALRRASAFGWYMYPPLNFSLVWDGTEIAWTYEGADSWYPLRSAQYPGFRRLFENAAPDDLKALAPDFPLRRSRAWCRPNLERVFGTLGAGMGTTIPRAGEYPENQGYEHFEGIVETDNWFGPLFTNIRLTQSNSPIEFSIRYPLFQVQPLLRECYLEPSFSLRELTELEPADWERFAATMTPNTDNTRPLGHYAVDARKRLRGSHTDRSNSQKDSEDDQYGSQ